MRRVINVIALFMVCAAGLCASENAQAFSFFPDNATTLHLVDVPEHVAGKTWAIAATEPWHQTKNTVWSHCEQVLSSYGSYTTADVISCEQDVAEINGLPPWSLDRLEVGQRIVLPLTLDMAASVTDTLAVADLTTEIDTLRTRMEEQWNTLNTRVTQLQAGEHADDVDINNLRTRIDSLEEKYTELSSAPVQSTPATTLVPATPETSARTTLAELWELLGEAWWIPLLIGGSILLLLLWGVILLLREQTERKERKALQLRVYELEKNFNFKKVPYHFDNKEYWIELIEVNKTGRVYKTPFAERVFEPNLKSHFAKATKEEPQLKAAA